MNGKRTQLYFHLAQENNDNQIEINQKQELYLNNEVTSLYNIEGKDSLWVFGSLCRQFGMIRMDTVRPNWRAGSV